MASAHSTPVQPGPPNASSNLTCHKRFRRGSSSAGEAALRPWPPSGALIQQFIGSVLPPFQQTADGSFRLRNHDSIAAPTSSEASMKPLRWLLAHLQQLFSDRRDLCLTGLASHAEFWPGHACSRPTVVIGDITRTDSTPALPPLQHQRINSLIYFRFSCHVCYQASLRMTSRGQFWFEIQADRCLN